MWDSSWAVVKGFCCLEELGAEKRVRGLPCPRVKLSQLLGCPDGAFERFGVQWGKIEGRFGGGGEWW